MELHNLVYSQPAGPIVVCLFLFYTFMSILTWLFSTSGYFPNYQKATAMSVFWPITITVCLLICLIKFFKYLCGGIYMIFHDND